MQVGLHHFKTMDWLVVHQSLVEEMVHVILGMPFKHYRSRCWKLLMENMIFTICWLLREGVVTFTWEGCDVKLSRFFKGSKLEHYVSSSGYLIAKAMICFVVSRLEALIEICTFRHGNRFALGALVWII
jgi:hypothetical protein